MAGLYGLAPSFLGGSSGFVVEEAEGFRFESEQGKVPTAPLSCSPADCGDGLKSIGHIRLCAV